MLLLLYKCVLFQIENMFYENIFYDVNLMLSISMNFLLVIVKAKKSYLGEKGFIF